MPFNVLLQRSEEDSGASMLSEATLAGESTGWRSITPENDYDEILIQSLMWGPWKETKVFVHAEEQRLRY
jgi:hypothetical protein